MGYGQLMKDWFGYSWCTVNSSWEIYRKGCSEDSAGYCQGWDISVMGKDWIEWDCFPWSREAEEFLIGNNSQCDNVDSKKCVPIAKQSKGNNLE